MDLLCRIGIIAVYQNIGIRINLAEHRPHDISFSLMFFLADYGSCPFCKFRSTIRGIIIVYIDFCFRKNRPEITDHFGNGQLFIKTRNQHCNFLITHTASILP